MRDDTNSLPLDSVFIGGLNALNCGRSKVFVTRYPCTEKGDGILVRIILSQPQAMSDDKWTHLKTMPYGMIVFGKSSDVLSTPEKINDGDLDGDLYHVLWDYSLVGKIEHAHNDNYEYTLDSLFDVDPPLDETNHIVEEILDNQERAHDLSVYVNSHDETNPIVEEILDNEEKAHDASADVDPVDKTKYIVEEILDNKGNQILVRWNKNGIIVDTWENLLEKRKEIPNLLAEYAREKGIMNESRWKWSKTYMMDAVMRFILSHEVSNNEIKFTISYQDGTHEGNVTFEDLKKDEPEKLFKYADTNDLLHEWRMEFASLAQESWFENAQECASQLKLLYHQSELKEKFHSLYKKKFTKEKDYQSAIAVSQAFKKSIDFRKHSTEIKLPDKLTDEMPKHLHKYIY